MPFALRTHSDVKQSQNPSRTDYSFLNYGYFTVLSNIILCFIIFKVSYRLNSHKFLFFIFLTVFFYITTSLQSKQSWSIMIDVFFCALNIFSDFDRKLSISCFIDYQSYRRSSISSRGQLVWIVHVSFKWNLPIPILAFIDLIYGKSFEAFVCLALYSKSSSESFITFDFYDLNFFCNLCSFLTSAISDSTSYKLFSVSNNLDF